MIRNTIPLLALFLGGLLLSGCASAPRNADQDAAYKKVLVVSLLEERVPIVRVGLTNLGAETRTVDLPGHPNELAASIVEQHLKARRLEWIVVRPEVDRAQLMAKWDRGNINPELVALMRGSDADAVFLIAAERTELRSTTGVGVYFRALSQTLLDDAFVHANVYIRLLGKNGQEIASRDAEGKSVAFVRVSNLGLTYDLSTVSNGSMPEAMSTALQQQLARSVDASIRSLGY